MGGGWTRGRGASIRSHSLWLKEVILRHDDLGIDILELPRETKGRGVGILDHTQGSWFGDDVVGTKGDSGIVGTLKD